MTKKEIEKAIKEYILKDKENYYRLAYSYVKNQHDALDIVQESIYKAMMSMNTLKNPKHVKTWFWRIVVNTSLDFLKKNKRINLVDEETLEFYSDGEGDRYKDFDLEDALNKLPPNYRNIIILRYFEDLKIEEVAEVLEENINTVKTRLYSALKKLRISIED
ncbi:sigma-70 family RNA polymerase sigma factor [Clostridiisalibacter paucivorans]|uniref:sigma-70 family RNA polymerase sigma factor n=1 Tax=Clostridiisalibacter paucivorans TaxID=408753 RepID=UPI00047DA54B|nr:sigma-70 family RNA polymerase sigma factor [Clostridiisalibacter paucivorans]